jgi:hypothetical protein
MDNSDLLLAAYRAKDADALREALARVNDRNLAPFLSKLLLEDWHDSHEDIVLELGLIGDPCAISSIEQAITIPFDSLVKWGNLHEFQRKCVYALARIATAESRAALERITKISDPQLQVYSEEGLQHWPMPYKGKQFA